jgi:hypothetical protein
MPAAEIGLAVTSLRSAIDIVKAMIGLRDAEAFRAKSIELQQVISDAYSQAIEAREAQSTQLDRIRALEAEVAELKAWGTEKENYELKQLWLGGVAYMLKPECRGSEPPHWLCPQCYANGKKAFFQPQKGIGVNLEYACPNCRGQMFAHGRPEWIAAARQS